MKLRALIVEDCDVMRALLTQLLPLTGLAEFKFKEARDGVEALEIFHPRHTDIIFVDWNMPKMSGFDFVRKVRASGKTDHIPIIMVTGERSMGKVEDALDHAGADVYITKPFTVEDLRRQLARSIEQIAAERSESPIAKPGGLLGRWIGSGR